MASWMQLNGRRLDCNPYLSGAFEAKVRLEKLRAKKQPLSELTTGYKSGIYNGPMFIRNYVDARKYGVPFLTSSSMLLADLSTVGLLSKKDAHSPKLRHLRIEEGMTLISCSGTIGNMVYARRDMEGMWSSQDVLKVVPNTSKIPSGYLYAYLSGKFGVPIVMAGTYGAIIQHIEPEHVAELPVPRLSNEIEGKADDFVTRAAQIRTNALSILYESGEQMLDAVGLKELPASYEVPKPLTSGIRSSSLRKRLEGAFHSPLALQAEEEVLKAHYKVLPLSDRKVTRKLFKPNIFKRAWVESRKYGPAFVSGNDIYRMNPAPNRFVSSNSSGIENYLLKKGTVVFQAAGQLNGIFGFPVVVNSHLDGMFCADDVFRVVPHSESDAGYIYAYLRTNYGQRLLKRQAYGYSIPRVVAEHVGQIVIPWASEEIRMKVGAPVMNAWEDLAQAIKIENQAVSLVEEAIEGGRF